MEQIASELTTDERMKIINGSNLDDRQKESLSEIAEKYQLTADEIQSAINKTLNGEYTQNQKTTMQNNEVLNQGQQITQDENKTAQNETSNDIGLNLRKSIDAYNNSRQEGDKIFDINDENTRKEIDAIQKIAEKRTRPIGINRSALLCSVHKAISEKAKPVRDDCDEVLDIGHHGGGGKTSSVEKLVDDELISCQPSFLRGNIMHQQPSTLSTDGGLPCPFLRAEHHFYAVVAVVHLHREIERSVHILLLRGWLQVIAIATLVAIHRLRLRQIEVKRLSNSHQRQQGHQHHHWFLHCFSNTV
jgi:hypothetical protein